MRRRKKRLAVQWLAEGFSVPLQTMPPTPLRFSTPPRVLTTPDTAFQVAPARPHLVER
jgi:hypothetical protein